MIFYRFNISVSGDFFKCAMESNNILFYYTINDKTERYGFEDISLYTLGFWEYKASDNFWGSFNVQDQSYFGERSEVDAQCTYLKYGKKFLGRKYCK